MLRILSRVIAVVISGLALVGGPSVAQEGSSPRAAEAAKGPESPAARIEESQPPLYYLKDKQGNLQAVPNFTLEDFEELYRLKHQLVQGTQRPRYSLQQMSATGSVGGRGYAELTIQFRVIVRDEQWVRVPLHLDQAVLSEPAQYQGPGEFFLHLEGEGEGYVAWIRGTAAQQPHQLTLKVLVPLAAVGDETRLKLLVPRAATAELKLKVPLADATAKVSEGATLAPPVSGKNDTEFTVSGVAGDFDMSWYKVGSQTTDVPMVLEAVGAIAVRLDSRGIDSEAVLAVRSYSAAFDRFRVRLPTDTELVPGSAAGYAVVALPAPVGAAVRQRVVEVRLPKRTMGPVEVRLASTRAHDAAKIGAWLDLAGFEVLEAARQWGSLAVSTAGEWQVLWGPSLGFRQVEQLPETLRRKDVVAGFDYLVQPCSLKARLVPKKTRINVEPEYLLLIDGESVRLEAKLKYTVRGAKVFALDVTMPDWQLDDVGPDNLVAVDGVPTSASNGPLSIPLLQPAAGQFEVHLRAHRALPAHASAVVVNLPQPQATAPAEAVVVVQPADNVELIPDSRAMAGLIRQQVAAPMELPPRQQDPLFYRTEAATAVFAADLRRHRQRIGVDVNTQVSLDDHGGRVEQKLTYTIAHEPTDHLLLDVPRALAETGQLELRYEGQPVAATLLAEWSETTAGPERMRVSLPKAAIGACELTAHYAIPAAPAAAGRHTRLAVPLVMPAEATLGNNRLNVTAAGEWHVEPRRGAWAVVDPEPLRVDQPPGLQLAADKPCAEVELDVQRESGVEAAAVVVERAWVQTRLTGSVRQDRALFQFTTLRPTVSLLFPAGTALEQVHVFLDGRRLSTVAIDEGGLTIPLNGEVRRERHLLELHYHVPGPRPPRGHMALELPRLGRDGWERRLYWQLILPDDEHVIVPPDDMTGESRWGWNGCFWGRQPLLDQAQLESWLGNSRPNAAAPADTNVYLFSTLGNVTRCELRTASRATIVLLASGLALLAGLTLIYLRASRHPATLLTASLALLAVGILYPEPALLIAQAAVLGLALALLSMLLARGTGWRRRTRRSTERASSVLRAAGHSTLSARLAVAHQRTPSAAATATANPSPADDSP